MYTLRQYLLSLNDPHGLFRTLEGVEVCRNTEGQPLYTTGNSAAVFRIHHNGSIRSLRCYFRPMRHLSAIYGKRLLPRELYLYTTPETGQWVDVVLGEWIEGTTLHHAITQAAEKGDRMRLASLSAVFDRLAATLTAIDLAHGDLKPENIIVTSEGALHLIDLDATFLPDFAGEQSPELGTAAYQHPARTAQDFDAALDDFPAALISTALHALALDPTLLTRHNHPDGLLFSPRTIQCDPAWQEVLALFEAEGMAVQYRIARLLTSPTHRLYRLSELLQQVANKVSEPNTPCPAITVPATETATHVDANAHDAAQTDAPPELFAEGGLWGYRTPERVVIPPLYDCGFDFTESLAAVRLATTWFFIDTKGHIVIRCTGCTAVKPFRQGRAQLLRDGQKIEIDSLGREFEF